MLRVGEAAGSCASAARQHTLPSDWPPAQPASEQSRDTHLAAMNCRAQPLHMLRWPQGMHTAAQGQGTQERSAHALPTPPPIDTLKSSGAILRSATPPAQLQLAAV